MKITRPMPVAGTRRTRKVYALLPKFFVHGSNNQPLRTLVWFDYYLVDETYEYGEWNYRGRRLDE
jgi:hypothetical protein